MFGICHDHVIEHFGHPAVIASVERVFCFVHYSVCAAHKGEIALGLFCWWQLIQGCRVAVEEAQVLNVYRPGIVMHGAVIVAVIKLLSKAGRQVDPFGDFFFVEAFVGKAQGLVVDVLI